MTLCSVKALLDSFNHQNVIYNLYTLYPIASTPVAN